MINRLEIIKYLKENLSEKRYNHSLMVEKRAVEIANIFQVDKYKCSIASLLHDVCKEMNINNMLQYVNLDDIMYKENFLECTGIWHSFCGAEFSKKHFFIEDEDILNAIRYHSTARVNMTDIEKVVFVSDFTSEDRVFSEAIEIRNQEFEDLNKLFVKVLLSNINFLINNKKRIYLETVVSYNHYIKLKEI